MLRSPPIPGPARSCLRGQGLLVLAGLVVAVVLTLTAGVALAQTSEALTQTSADGPGWMWPLPAPHLVVHPFAPPAHDWMPGHRGVDLAAEPGVQVVAAGVGRVVFAGVIDRVGVVAIRHPDGLETTYEPLRPAVRAGAQVAAGAVIGRVERLGSHCAPRTCLHWGLRRGAAYLDPLGLVGAERVRLLPLLTDSARPTWPVSAAAGSSTVILGWAMASTRRRRRDPRAP